MKYHTYAVLFSNKRSHSKPSKSQTPIIFISRILLVVYERLVVLVNKSRMRRLTLNAQYLYTYKLKSL